MREICKMGNSYASGYTKLQIFNIVSMISTESSWRCDKVLVVLMDQLNHKTPVLKKSLEASSTNGRNGQHISQYSLFLFSWQI